jgi:hypothetical protein
MPIHLPLFLEIGASNSVQIDLISIGLSRMTALELSKHIAQDSYDRDMKVLKVKLKELSKNNADIPPVCIKEIKHYIF